MRADGEVFRSDLAHTETNNAQHRRLGTKLSRHHSPNWRNMMRLRLRLIAFILAFWPLLAIAAQPGWLRFEVPTSGASVDIPTSIFSQRAGKPEPGDGARFTTPDRRADLTVVSIINTNGSSPAGYLASKKPPRQIAYKRITSRFFAVSDIREGKTWYDRCNFAGRFITCVLINYPADEERQWDDIVTRISLSLAP